MYIIGLTRKKRVFFSTGNEEAKLSTTGRLLTISMVGDQPKEHNISHYGSQSAPPHRLLAPNRALTGAQALWSVALAECSERVNKDKENERRSAAAAATDAATAASARTDRRFDRITLPFSNDYHLPLALTRLLLLLLPPPPAAPLLLAVLLPLPAALLLPVPELVLLPLLLLPPVTASTGNRPLVRGTSMELLLLLLLLLLTLPLLLWWWCWW